MSTFHDKYNQITAKNTINLNYNIRIVDYLCKDCDDFVKRRCTIGGKNKIDIYFLYIDNMVDTLLLEEDTLRNLLYKMDDLPSNNQFEYIKDKGLRSA